jgi:hypothetical protein
MSAHVKRDEKRELQFLSIGKFLVCSKHRLANMENSFRACSHEERATVRHEGLAAILVRDWQVTSEA